MSSKFSMKGFVRHLDELSPYPFFYSFRMSDNEIGLFNKVIKKSEVYLEFGMGGSTFHVLKNSNAIVYSIDSCQNWIKGMKNYFYIRRMEKKRLKLFHVNIGRTRKWGFPEDNSNSHLFPEYSAGIFKNTDLTADTVLIDGRFRVACTLKTVLEYGENKNLRLIIHDFWNRPDYHIVLKYLTEIESADTMCVLRVKDNVDMDAVAAEYDNYKFIAD